MRPVLPTTPKHWNASMLQWNPEFTPLEHELANIIDPRAWKPIPRYASEMAKRAIARLRLNSLQVAREVGKANDSVLADLVNMGVISVNANVDANIPIRIVHNMHGIKPVEDKMNQESSTMAIHTYYVNFVDNLSDKKYMYRSLAYYKEGEYVLVDGAVCCVVEALYNANQGAYKWIQGRADTSVPDIAERIAAYEQRRSREAWRERKQKLLNESNELARKINERREAIRLRILDDALANDVEYQGMILSRAAIDRQIHEMGS